jgi:hypothetical protein
MNSKLLLYKITAALFSLVGLFFMEVGIFYNPVFSGSLLLKIYAAAAIGIVGYVTWRNFFVGKFSFGYYSGHISMYLYSLTFFVAGVMVLLSAWMHHNLFLYLGSIGPLSYFVFIKILEAVARKYPHGQDFFKIYFNNKKRYNARR